MPIRSANQRKVAELWYQALRARHGLKVRGHDARALKALFYHVRRELEDESLRTLSIRISPDNPAKEIWIVHPAEDSIPARPALPTPDLDNL